MIELKVTTSRRTELVDVTDRVRDVVAGEAGSLVTLFVPHTTAGVVLQAAGEGAAAVANDLADAFERIVDEDADWQHVHEGDRNPWAHVRAALTASSVAIPLGDGELVLGDHQAVFLAEFDGPRERTLTVSIT
ncbi:MAG: secondary thiamine-phosphate synthase enzyme YjbQ [Gaiellaceae bacterium]